jgi:acyl-CoA thioesterase-1
VPYRYSLLAALLLVGCHNKEEPKPDPGPPPELPAGAPATPRPDGRPAIVAFGDSLTAGYGVEPGLSYPDYLQKLIDAKGLRYQVINAGGSGETTTSGLARVDSVLAYKPSIVILEFGGNDGLRGQPVSQTKANLEQMILRLQKGGARVVLAGIVLPPNYGDQYIRSFVKNYTDLAAKYRLPFIPFLLDGIYDKPGMMQSDGIHPTAAGNKVVAETVFHALEPLLR